MGYGQLYIIPDENKILSGVFHRVVKSNHLDEIQLFSDQYQLGYQFRKEQYHDAPCYLALDGHLVIKTVDDCGNFICYIPEMVTDDQNVWFYENSNFIKKYSNFGAYRVKKKENSYEVIEIEGFDEVMKYINHGNLLYQKFLNNRKAR